MFGKGVLHPHLKFFKNVLRRNAFLVQLQIASLQFHQKWILSRMSFKGFGHSSRTCCTEKQLLVEQTPVTAEHLFTGCSYIYIIFCCILSPSSYASSCLCFQCLRWDIPRVILYLTIGWPILFCCRLVKKKSGPWDEDDRIFLCISIKIHSNTFQVWIIVQVGIMFVAPFYWWLVSP